MTEKKNLTQRLVEAVNHEQIVCMAIGDLSQLPVKDWEIEYLQYDGVVSWWNGKLNAGVRATPWWDDNSHIPIEVYDEDGDNIEELDGNYEPIKFKSSKNIITDIDNYMKIMTPVIKRIENDVKKLRK